MNDVKGPPDGAAEISGGMSNFDYRVTPGFEDTLRAGNVYGRHAAWEFNGLVWFEEGLFHEQVWRYHQPIGHHSEPTLQELMTVVNDAYGWD